MRIALAVAGFVATAAISACESRPATAPGRSLGGIGPVTTLVPADAQVVMRGLDNPRGLAFGPEGALYVAEAGRGPSDPGCFTNAQSCACVMKAMLVCFGPTGAVSRLWRGRQERVATGLPSYSNAAGRSEGPNDIAMLGVGAAHLTIGLEDSPLNRDEFSAVHPEFAAFGRLVRVMPSGQWRFVADLAAYETAANPDPRILDSNPYGLLAVPSGVIVAEAGGNAILRVSANYDISTVAVMPQVAQATTGDAVPTSIAIGPDGAFYVGVLTGAPWRDGSAAVYRVVPGQTPQPFRTGFKAIIDIAFDALGRLLVLQHSTGTTGIGNPGMLVRVSADGTTRQILIADLVRPTSVAVDGQGAIYLSHRGLSPGSGEVLRIDP